jgi:hypothetical protein
MYNKMYKCMMIISGRDEQKKTQRNQKVQMKEKMDGSQK